MQFHRSPDSAYERYGSSRGLSTNLARLESFGVASCDRRSSIQPMPQDEVDPGQEQANDRTNASDTEGEGDAGRLPFIAVF